MDKFVQYAQTIHTYSGASVMPLAGSPIAQAVDVIVPNREVTDPTEITEGLESAINETLIDFVGGYGEITESLINEAVSIATGRLSFIQNTVAPLSAKFAERVAGDIEKNADAISILDFEVTEHSLPDIAYDERFLGLCENYTSSEGFTNVALAPGEYLIDESDEVLTRTLESGISDWDKMVSDIVVNLGEEGMAAAFTRVFRNSRRLSFDDKQGATVITYANDLKELEDYISMFLFMNSVVVGGYENEGQLRSGKFALKTVLRKNAAALASSIKSIINLYSKDVETGRVIRNIDNEHNVIEVYRDNFMDFTANGGEIEVIKMAALLAYDGKPKYSKSTTEELLAVSKEATEMFENRINEIERNSREEALERSKNHVGVLFNELISTVPELELQINNREQLLKSGTINAYFADIGIEDFADRPRELAIDAFCKCVYPEASFDKFLKKMNEYSKVDSTLTPRRAAYKAFVNELVANLLKQVKKVSE